MSISLHINLQIQLSAGEKNEVPFVLHTFTAWWPFWRNWPQCFTVHDASLQMTMIENPAFSPWFLLRAFLWTCWNQCNADFWCFAAAKHSLLTAGRRKTVSPFDLMFWDYHLFVIYYKIAKHQNILKKWCPGFLCFGTPKWLHVYWVGKKVRNLTFTGHSKRVLARRRQQQQQQECQTKLGDKSMHRKS